MTTGDAPPPTRVGPGPKPVGAPLPTWWVDDTPATAVAAVAAVAVSVMRVVSLLVRGRVSQPTDQVGRRIHFDDGTSAEVYRETVIDRPPPTAPAFLVVCFRLRLVRRPWAHRLFRIESELNTILFAGFRGLVSKLWLCHDDQQRYRGVYQWDDAALARTYAAIVVVGVAAGERSRIHPLRRRRRHPA